jgi:hypothetical protein
MPTNTRTWLESIERALRSGWTADAADRLCAYHAYRAAGGREPVWTTGAFVVRGDSYAHELALDIKEGK